MRVFVRRRSRRNGNYDHKEGNQRRIESGVGDRREDFANAIENKGESIDYLISDEDVPWLV